MTTEDPAYDQFLYHHPFPRHGIAFPSRGHNLFPVDAPIVLEEVGSNPLAAYHLNKADTPDGSPVYVIGKNSSQKKLVDEEGRPLSYMAHTMEIPEGAILLDGSFWNKNEVKNALNNNDWGTLQTEVAATITASKNALGGEHLPGITVDILSNFTPYEPGVWKTIDLCNMLVDDDSNSDQASNQPLRDFTILEFGTGICARPIVNTSMPGNVLIYYLPVGIPSRQVPTAEPYKYPLKAFTDKFIGSNLSIETKGLFLLPISIGKNIVAWWVLIDTISPYNTPDLNFQTKPAMTPGGRLLHTQISTYPLLSKWVKGPTPPNEYGVAVDDDVMLPIDKWLGITCFNADLIEISPSSPLI